MTARIVYRNAAGQMLTTDDLRGTTGAVDWQIVGGQHVPNEARRLHQQAREAGGQGDYERAFRLLDQAHALAPAWPFPSYDAAFTALLNGDTARAEELYEQVDRLAPRGFFTCKTTLDMLRRERAGMLFPGFSKAFIQLEWLTDRVKKTAVLQGIVQRYPQFPPAWKELAMLLEDPDERLQALTRGLEGNPDPETRGMLLINQALLLHRNGDQQTAIHILGELALDPSATLAAEALAKFTLGRILDLADGSQQG